MNVVLTFVVQYPHPHPHKTIGRNLNLMQKKNIQIEQLREKIPASSTNKTKCKCTVHTYGTYT